MHGPHRDGKPEAVGGLFQDSLCAGEHALDGFLGPRHHGRALPLLFRHELQALAGVCSHPQQVVAFAAHDVEPAHALATMI